MFQLAVMLAAVSNPFVRSVHGQDVSGQAERTDFNPTVEQTKKIQVIKITKITA